MEIKTHQHTHTHANKIMDSSHHAVFFHKKKNISDKRLMSFSMNYVKKQHIFVVLTSTAQMHNAINIFNSNAHRHFLSMINDNNLS